MADSTQDLIEALGVEGEDVAVADAMFDEPDPASDPMRGE